jgi:hypothetical protein
MWIPLVCVISLFKCVTNRNLTRECAVARPQLTILRNLRIYIYDSIKRRTGLKATVLGNDVFRQFGTRNSRAVRDFQAFTHV